MEKILRKIVTFTASMIVTSFSAVIATRANLGVSPITSIPYVSSIVIPTDFGAAVFTFNLVFFLLGIIIMRRDYKPLYALCIVFALVFSTMCDVYDSFLPYIDGSDYLMGWVFEIISAVTLAFGIALSALSSLTMLPADFFTRFVSTLYGFNFGYTKLVLDGIFVVITLIIGLVFLGRIEGIREGTLFLIIAVGPLLNVCMRLLTKAKFDAWVGTEPIEIGVSRRG